MATASPIPVAPPVTMATFPFRRFCVGISMLFFIISSEKGWSLVTASGTERLKGFSESGFAGLKYFQAFNSVIPFYGASKPLEAVLEKQERAMPVPARFSKVNPVNPEILKIPVQTKNPSLFLRPADFPQENIGVKVEVEGVAEIKAGVVQVVMRL